MSEMKYTKGQKVEYRSDDGVFFAPPLLPCPCCGGSTDIHFRGNDQGRSRQVKIKCSDCRLERTNAGLRNSSERVARISIDQWNKRLPTEAAAPEIVELLELIVSDVDNERDVTIRVKAESILSKIKNQTDEPTD